MNKTDILIELKNLYKNAVEKKDIKTAMSLLKLIGQEKGMFRTNKPEKIYSIKDLTDDQIDQLIASTEQKYG